MGGGSAYAIPNVMVSTTGEIPGHTINRYLGVVFGITVRSRGAGGQCIGGCQVCVGEGS